MRTLLFTILLLTSPFSFSQEAKGTIEEIQICATGETGNSFWARTLQFKVDGKWFGTWADYYGSSTDYENTISTSLIFMAYSQNLPVHIKASDSWHYLFNRCGVSQGHIFNSTGGDFIRISR